jgi:hypothetical protein
MEGVTLEVPDDSNFFRWEVGSYHFESCSAIFQRGVPFSPLHPPQLCCVEVGADPVLVLVALWMVS